MKTEQNSTDHEAPPQVGGAAGAALLDRIDWNDSVTMMPNRRGWAVWERHYNDMGIEPPEHSDTLEMALWEAAQIFGGSLYNGCKLPFENTDMEYRKSV